MTNLFYSNESIFNKKNVQTIVNTINCVGIMGAGIALEFKLRYPELHKDYVKRCKRHEVKIGEPYLYISKEVRILNFPTKKHWKDESKLEWIEAGLKFFMENYKNWGITSIAFTQLGTVNGRLDWKEVRKSMESQLIDIDIPVYICLDTKEELDGLEKQMTEYLNKLDENYLIKIGINKLIIPKMLENLPIEKFRYLREKKGIGKISYERLYQYIHNQIVNKKEFSPIYTTQKLSDIKIQNDENKFENHSNYMLSTNLDLSDNKLKIDKSRIKELKSNIDYLLELKKKTEIISEQIQDLTLTLIKEYLKSKHPNVNNWILNLETKKDHNIKGILNNNILVIGDVKSELSLSKNDFQAKYKKQINKNLKSLDLTNCQHKYFFVLNNRAYNILQTKYKKLYPSIEFVNITEPKSNYINLSNYSQ